MSKNITVHDPRGFPPTITGKVLAPRLESLDGRSIYLVDCLFDNSAVFMDQLQGWFSDHLPSVRTEVIRPLESWVDDLDMRTTIETNGDAAILGVGL
jgi:hypothetical protein